MYQSIAFLGTIVLTLISLLVINKKDKAFSIYLKIVTIVFCAIGFFRFMLSDSFIWVINGGYYSGTYYKSIDVLQSILRWGYYLNYAVLPMAVFFNNRIFRNIAIYFCLPFSILSTIFMGDFFKYFLDPMGRGLHLSATFRYIYFIIELILAMSIPLMVMFGYKHFFNIKDKKEWINFFCALPLVLLQMMPVYLPQSLLGYTGLVAKSFSMVHIVWLLITLLVIFGLYYFFRFKDYDTRYQLCVFLSIALFFHYDSLYLMGFSIPRLPIQLCNLGAYFFLIAVVFRLKKFFDFTFIVNITGAAVAMLMPDIDGGVMGFWNIHFMFEHSLVVIVPALCMALRIFPRVNAKSIKYAFIGYSCYFMFCLISGTILNGFSAETGFKVNYFYIFDLKKAFDYFPFLRFTQNIYIRAGRFIVYPLFQLIIYLGFFGICLLFYWLVQSLYKMTDDHLQLRLSRIDLYEKITKKKSKAPRDFVD